MKITNAPAHGIETVFDGTKLPHCHHNERPVTVDWTATVASLLTQLGCGSDELNWDLVPVLSPTDTTPVAWEDAGFVVVTASFDGTTIIAGQVTGDVLPVSDALLIHLVESYTSDESRVLERCDKVFWMIVRTDEMLAKQLDLVNKARIEVAEAASRLRYRMRLTRLIGSDRDTAFAKLTALSDDDLAVAVATALCVYPKTSASGSMFYALGKPTTFDSSWRNLWDGRPMLLRAFEVLAPSKSVSSVLDAADIYNIADALGASGIARAAFDPISVMLAEAVDPDTRRNMALSSHGISAIQDAAPLATPFDEWSAEEFDAAIAEGPTGHMRLAIAFHAMVESKATTGAVIRRVAEYVAVANTVNRIAFLRTSAKKQEVSFRALSKRPAHTSS